MSAEFQQPPDPQAERRSGIGGGDIAAIVGVDQWRKPWDVFAFKRALIDSPDPADLPEWMRWGSILERPILEEYGRLEGAQDLQLLFDKLFRHPVRSWQIGHPDAERPNLDMIVEGKAVGYHQAEKFGEPRTDEIPENYIIQAQWYMSLRDRESAHVVVLVGGQELRVYTVHRNPTLEAFLLEKADQFWTKHVLADVPPEMGDTNAAAEYLRKVFPRERVELRKANGKELLIVQVYAEARAKAKMWETLKSGLENQLKSHIGEAVGIQGEDFKITWKKIADGEKTDWEAAARAALTTLQLLGSQTGGSAAALRRLAREAAEELIPKHTSTKLGYRRFLPSGPAFKQEEEQANA